MRSSIDATASTAHTTSSSFMATSALSRSGSSHPRGKFVPVKFSLPSSTLEALEVAASECGMPLAEYLRIVVEAHAHGAEDVERVAKERIRRVLRTGSETSVEGA